MLAAGMFFALYSSKYKSYTHWRVKNMATYYIDRGVCFSDPFFLASIAAVSLVAALQNPFPLIGYPPIYLLVTVWLNFDRIDRSTPPINKQLKDYLWRVIRRMPLIKAAKNIFQLTQEILSYLERTREIVLVSDVKNIALYSLYINAELERYPNKSVEQAVSFYLTVLCFLYMRYLEEDKLLSSYEQAILESQTNLFKKLFFKYRINNIKKNRHSLKLFAWNLAERLKYIQNNIHNPELTLASESEFMADIKKRELV
jgi:hypothetical protein